MFEPGTLKTKVAKQTKAATAKGTLIPAVVEHESTVIQSNIPFIVRIAPNLERKDKARVKQDKETLLQGQEPNPFLPFNPDLYVSNLSPTHLCLLNRFKLFDYPLLVVTRAFEEQASMLTYNDFFSICICMQEMDGLAFYNGGLNAGASQRHKHFHFIPYPFDNKLSTFPIDTTLKALPLETESIQLETFPYQHLISRIDWPNNNSTNIAAEMLLSKYQALMFSMEQINSTRIRIKTNSIYPYNLLITRHWMKLALRSAPAYASIPLNSLGFAGIFNVRSEFQVNQVKDLLPLKILQGIGVPNTTTH